MRPHRRSVTLGFALAAVVPIAALVAIGLAVAGVARPSAVAALARGATGAEAPPGPSGRQTVSIAWVGDTMLGRDGAVAPRRGRAIFAGVRGLLRAPDVTIGNLEGVLTTLDGSKCAPGAPDCYAFRASPATAGTLRWAGFDVLNLANNHAWDFGVAGQASTVHALRTRGMQWTGVPGKIALVRRGAVRVAVVGFAPYRWAPSLLDPGAARALVRRAAAMADVVVACLHAGGEGRDRTHTPAGRETAFGEDRGETRAFAHALVDAGADLVVGSGPHVLRGIERYRGRIVAYSLGNFAGHHNFATGGALSLGGVLSVRLRRSGRPLAGHFASTVLDAAGAPARDRTGAAARLVASVSRADFGPAAVAPDAGGRLPVAP